MHRDASEFRLKLLEWTCGSGRDVQWGAGGVPLLYAGRQEPELARECASGRALGCGALGGQAGCVRHPRFQPCPLPSALLQQQPPPW